MASCGRNLVPISDFPTKNDRLDRLKQLFLETFGGYPKFVVRVPGRVNLIGEHIDYCGYGVCPMALQQDMLLAVSENNTRNIVLVNANKKYKKQVLEPAFSGCKSPEWEHYFLCGVRGVQEALPGDFQLKGMNIVADGNIPPSAGLSSSSALVSASALCTFYINGITPVKEDIADLCAKAERYIGTQGGGMDQAIAFLATDGCAKYIEFNPLRATDIKLPEGAVFVIAHSLAEKNKAASNDFNCRVVECRLAAQLLAKAKEVDWRNVKKLGDVHNMLGVDLVEMIQLVKSLLHEESYKKAEIAEILGISELEMEENSLTKNTEDVKTFKLRQRALHVFEEAERVRQFKAICEKTADVGTLRELGSLMYQSHESLRDLYEASHPQLDKIVDISRKFCYGCRLTGAGWGGCTVALVAPDKVEEYLNALKVEFYADLNVAALI
ncbi:hypothetical protein WA026_020441 [Henosepilachna vigintioctopunctata]|uniref:Galactokinase n=1 Tax=Henosepilachna vigintioctopunctata TaxID=420089 RepID=A0AAW1UI23_9CUCU